VPSYKGIGVSLDHIIKLNINFVSNVQRLANVKFNHRFWLVFQILTSNNNDHYPNTHGERLKIIIYIPIIVYLIFKDTYCIKHFICIHFSST